MTMKLAVFVMFFVAVGLLVLGWHIDQSGSSADERAGSALFYLIGLGLLIIDGFTALVYVVVK